MRYSERFKKQTKGLHISDTFKMFLTHKSNITERYFPKRVCYNDYNIYNVLAYANQNPKMKKTRYSRYLHQWSNKFFTTHGLAKSNKGLFGYV